MSGWKHIWGKRRSLFRDKWGENGWPLWKQERELRKRQLGNTEAYMLGWRNNFDIKEKMVTKSEICFERCLSNNEWRFSTYLIATLLPSITTGLRFSSSSAQSLALEIQTSEIPGKMFPHYNIKCVLTVCSASLTLQVWQVLPGISLIKASVPSLFSTSWTCSSE